MTMIEEPSSKPCALGLVEAQNIFANKHLGIDDRNGLLNLLQFPFIKVTFDGPHYYGVDIKYASLPSQQWNSQKSM